MACWDWGNWERDKGIPSEGNACLHTYMGRCVCICMYIVFCKYVLHPHVWLSQPGNAIFQFPSLLYLRLCSMSCPWSLLYAMFISETTHPMNLTVGFPGCHPHITKFSLETNMDDNIRAACRIGHTVIKGRGKDALRTKAMGIQVFYLWTDRKDEFTEILNGWVCKTQHNTMGN